MDAQPRQPRRFGVFSPLVSRELLGLARRPWTYRSRALVCFAAVAVLAVLVAGQSGAGMTMSVGAGLRPARWLFTGLFFVACVTGLQSAADCLSSERRQGTLGLLFLTDLKPDTVIAAKLISSSFQCLYALLAALPILTTCVLAGGVTGVFVLKSSIAVIYALLLSTLVGLRSSCRTADAHESFSRAIRRFALWNVFPLVSPLWLSLFGAQARGFMYFTFSVLFGALAVFQYWRGCRDALAGNWRESLDQPKDPGLQSLGQLTAAVRLKRSDFRPEPVGESDPATSIVSRHGDPRQARPTEFPKLFAGVIVVVWFMASLQDDAEIFTNSHLLLTWLLRFILIVTMCKIAPQGFGETLRGGGVEILLTTPLTVERLVNGARRFLARQFRGVLTVLVVADVGCVLLVQALSEMRNTAFRNFLVALVEFNVITVLGLASAGYFGVWMGLRYRRLTRAVVRTALMSIVAPHFIYQWVNSERLGRASFYFAGWYLLWIVVGRARIKAFINAARDGARLTRPDAGGQ